MRYKAVLIAGGVALAAIATAAMAQGTRQPDAGENSPGRQVGPSQGGQGQTPGEARSDEQAQPQGAAGPIDTKSGGAPASSPQGETPAGMQTPSQGSPEQSGQSHPDAH
jgi:hypothetical protein